MRTVFRWLVVALVLTFTSLRMSGHAPDPLELPPSTEGESLAFLAPVVPLQPVEPSAAIETLAVPDRCDRLVLIDTPSGLQLSKERPKWLRSAASRSARQREVERVVDAVAAEMGVDETAAAMIWRKAIYESSGNAGNVHIRSADLEANRTAAAWGRRRSSRRWRYASVPVYRKVQGAMRLANQHDAWALGRGLYGQVTGLHMHRWSTDAPPWSLCDPVIATITVVWSMRAGLTECRGSTLRDAYRRFSSGKCAIRSPELERRFDRLAAGRVRGLKLEPFNPDASAVLGTRWPEGETDRRALLAAVHRRLALAD